MKAILPPLPYAFDALEPAIDARTVEIHYTRHHQAYVDGLNAALTRLEAARASGDFTLIKHLKREVAFHGSGHILHSLYWVSMTTGGSPLSSGALHDALVAKFGSMDTFEKEFRAAAAAVEASGWALLVLVS